VVRFRDNGRSSGRTLGLVLGVLIVGGVLLAALAWCVGPPILNWLFGAPSTINGEFVAILVISSAFVAALTVTGSAVLARSRHFIYSLGWVLAATTTIVFMSLSFTLVVRVETALFAGPVVGLVFHCVWLGWNQRIHRADAFLMPVKD
jgi:O-antigen/teichoic acid export membrane protein